MRCASLVPEPVPDAVGFRRLCARLAPVPCSCTSPEANRFAPATVDGPNRSPVTPLSVASAPVIGSLALLSSAAGLCGVLPTAAPASSPPSTDPATETTSEAPAGNPEFERNLAELAFALFLGSELDVNAGSYSCTEPASASVGETITCFTLIGSERVVVAVTELTGISGSYEFVVISDHHIDPVDFAAPSTDPPTANATTLPVPVLVTTTAPLSLAVRLADQTIAMTDWLTESPRPAEAPERHGAPG